MKLIKALKTYIVKVKLRKLRKNYEYVFGLSDNVTFEQCCALLEAERKEGDKIKSKTESWLKLKTYSVKS